MDRQNENPVKVMVCSHDPQIFNHINMCISKNIGQDVLLEVDYSGVGKPLLEDGWGCQLDILFLDIDLRDTDCLALAHHFRRANPDALLLFLIDKPEQAIHGYELRTFRCLNKKNLYQELEKRLGDIRKELGIGRDMVEFHFVDKLQGVCVDDILYAESQSHTIAIHYRSKNREPNHLFSTLVAVDELLAPHGFYRINNSFVVNIAYVDNLTHEWATLANGLKLPVGEHRFQKANALHQKYLKENAL